MLSGPSSTLTLHLSAIALGHRAVILSNPSKRSPPPNAVKEIGDPDGLPRHPAEPGLLTMNTQPSAPLFRHASS